MIKVSLSWIATQVGGQLQGEDAEIDGVSTDTRNIQAGDLFIALVGPNFNGHQFAQLAADKGASAMLVSEPVDSPLPQILVADTRIALGALAKGVKRQVAPKTVAITGSAGKTTVKEMVAAILARKGTVLATQGNFNNDIGVPLTLLRLTEEHEYAVIELGANHLGEIAYTCSLVEPDVATITNAAAAHLEGFGSLLGVARAKSEIFKGLSDKGTAVINDDSQFAVFWQGKLHRQKMVRFGQQADVDYRAEDVILGMDGCAQFELVTPIGEVAVELTTPGIHNVDNALCAAALAVAMGATLEDIKLGLKEMQKVKGRLNVKQLTNQVKLIDDSYNANVTSVNAAIDLLSSFSGRQVLVLGDMGELGEKARYYHEQVGAYARQQGIHDLLTLGVLSQSASAEFGQLGHHFSDVDAMVGYLEQHLASEQRDITILVKGSRSARMERVVEAIEASPLGKRFRVRERIAC